MRSGTEGKRTRELVVVTGIAVFAGVCVAGIAAAISYSHMFDWARTNGEVESHEWRAQLFPISVDGAIVVASAVIYADARAKRGRDWMAYLVGAIGIVWSIGANVGHTWEHPVAKMLISAWPPIALAFCVELILRLVKRVREQSELPQLSQLSQQVTRKTEKPAPKVKPAPVVTVAEIVPEIPVQAASVADDAHVAGWALADYATAKDAMLGYLDKVSPGASGADLDRIVGEHFAVSSGYGRKVVREFKALQAAASESGN